MATIQDILDYRQRNNCFGNYLGVKIVDLQLGFAKCELPIKADFMDPNKTVHGGVIFTLADITAGTAASSHGLRCTTVDSSISYLVAAMSSKVLYCEAREIKRGKTISVYETRITDDAE